MSRQVLGGARSVSGPTTAVQAHRGSPDQATGVLENTLEAFARARSLGADGVELDVRLTADGGLAIHHDPVIPGVGAVHELATAELPVHVPILGEALDACAGMVVNIEVKNLPTEPAFDPGERCARAVAALVEASGAEGSVIVSSFWGGALSAVRDTGPGIRTGLLVISSFDHATAVTGAVDLGCAAVHLPLGLVTPDSVAAAHAAGLDVAAWTVADEQGLATVLGAGVDTIVTDDVALARRAVDRD
jgi:glycerophosphoryl diester phosphodiesterase